MILKIRYDNKYNEIELTKEDTDKIWISLSLEGKNLTDKEKEKLIQDEFENMFNKKEYNNWQREHRHLVDADTLFQNLKDYESIDSMDKFVDKSSEKRYLKQQDEELLIEKINKILKPSQAKLLIDVCVYGLKLSEIAKRDGVSKSAISHRLETARNNFIKKCPTPSIFKNF